MSLNDKQEKQNALAQLHKWIKPSQRVYTVLRHRAKSGMSRSISVLIARGDEVLDITYFVARALDRSIDQNHGGIRMRGCGMDMGFEIVYSLSRVLRPDGFVPAEHGLHGRNRSADTDLDKDGGYSLRHVWL